MIPRLIASILMVIYFVSTSKGDLPFEVGDQSHRGGPGPGGVNALIVDSRFSSAQTYTAGVSGRLSRVVVDVYKKTDIQEPLFVDIVRTQAGQPSFASVDRLATQIIPPGEVRQLIRLEDANVPIFNISVDFAAAGLHVNTGDVLGIVMRSDAPETLGYSWFLITGKSYPGGSAYALRHSNNVLSRHSTFDAEFATFVIIPEPSSLLLVTFATLAALGAYRRKNRRM
jgi:hypothetical protein